MAREIIMFKDLVKRNRSYRGYDASYHFTREELMDFVDHARLTPASVNLQPLKYFLAWEPEKVALIGSMIKWARMLPKADLPHKGMEPTGFIVICQDTKVSPALNRFQKDVGIAAQTILLAAAEKELGGCMIGNFNAGEVKEKLGLPENIAPMLVVALGKPAETVILEEIGPDGSTKYYRDDQDRHHVPKRSLNEIIL